jgi:hypothetical protein
MGGHVDALDHSIRCLDKKLDALLLNEARREGEFSGIKKSALIVATIVTAIINLAWAAVASLVR